MEYIYHNIDKNRMDLSFFSNRAKVMEITVLGISVYQTQGPWKLLEILGLPFGYHFEKSLRCSVL